MEGMWRPNSGDCTWKGEASSAATYRLILTKQTNLVSIACRVVLGAHDETTALLGTAVNGLDDVDEFLFVLEHEIELVVVAGSQIHHDQFVAEEEHDGHGIVQLIPSRSNVSKLFSDQNLCAFW